MVLPCIYCLERHSDIKWSMEYLDQIVCSSILERLVILAETLSDKIGETSDDVLFLHNGYPFSIFILIVSEDCLIQMYMYLYV